MINLEYLKIENFRGFDSIEIDGFSKINLFVGKNNSGKTSILEAIFLMVGMNNGQLIKIINQNIRGLGTDKKNDSYLFHNLKYENPPSFYTKFSNETERWLEMKPVFRETGSLLSVYSSDFEAKRIIDGVEYNCTIKKIKKESYTFFVPYTEQKKLPDEYSDNLFVKFFIPNKGNFNALPEFSEIVKRKEEKAIIDALRVFDDNILDVKPLDDGIYFDIKNIDELIPCNIIGDGVRGFFNILTIVFEKQNSIICIDEIENGLHYSNYKLLWKSLLAYTRQNNVQLFITTHNIEVLSCLKAVLEEEKFKDMQNATKVFSISKTEKAGYKAYGYSFEGFRDAIDYETGIRD